MNKKGKTSIKIEIFSMTKTEKKKTVRKPKKIS